MPRTDRGIFQNIRLSVLNPGHPRQARWWVTVPPGAVAAAGLRTITLHRDYPLHLSGWAWSTGWACPLAPNPHLGRWPCRDVRAFPDSLVVQLRGACLSRPRLSGQNKAGSQGQPDAWGLLMAQSGPTPQDSQNSNSTRLDGDVTDLGGLSSGQMCRVMSRENWVLLSLLLPRPTPARGK